MRILFMGTPDIAADCLKALYEAGHDICAVYTRRDKPVGRKQVLTAPPVKEVALEHGTPVFQPRTLRDGSEDANIRALAPDLIVVVAYGCILPKSVLEAPKYGCINIHASLLPQYRGSAPYQWAVLDGLTETGVTAMYLTREMDAGDIIDISKTPIGENETAGELLDHLAVLGAELLSRTLTRFESGKVPATPQDASGVSYAPMLDKSMCPIDWTKTAQQVHNHVRGLHPWPVATMELQGKTFKVHATRVVEGSGKPGEILSLTKTGLRIACGEGAVEIISLQAEGGKRMAAPDYFRGHPLER